MPEDPQVGYRFAVEIAGIQDAWFTECSGFEVKVDVEEYKEGGLNEYIHRLPGRQSYGNVTLKRGVCDSIELYEWLTALTAASGKNQEKKNISVVMYNGKNEERLRWNLIAAYPIKWNTGSMQSEQSSIVIESLELTYQEFTLQTR